MAGRAPPGSHGVIFTPWLYGERTPVEDRSVRGGFHNLSLSTTRDDLVRAVFEGVALNTRWLLGPSSTSPAAGWSRSGSSAAARVRTCGARSSPTCSAAPIEQVADPVNANARGAGLLAAVALGELTFDQVPDRVRVAGATSQTRRQQGLYDELFREFTGFYRRNRKAYARLNRTRVREGAWS